MDNARCVMCERGVHFEEGRIACDGCNLPTDCCLCQKTSVAPATEAK
ncbi:MAG: hypothetical protein ACRD0Q_08230 [Acidimicrobiales bacterium]